jgi:hypothetical protein
MWRIGTWRGTLWRVGTWRGDGIAPPVTPPVPPDYRTIATQIFSGQRTGALNQIYALIARRR